jgi:predicted RNA-binding Zn-ribbon protein involved in translation (DUF1610 family)
MSSITTLQNQVIDLQKTMVAVQETMNQLQGQIKILTDAEEFDVFVQKEIAPYFGESTAENIVTMLQKCRKEGNNYQLFNPVYQWKNIHGDLQKRQLLKLISAVYRIKYQKISSNIYSLRSDVKYAKACPECGKIAESFYNRLMSEGLI